MHYDYLQKELEYIAGTSMLHYVTLKRWKNRNGSVNFVNANYPRTLLVVFITYFRVNCDTQAFDTS